MEKKKVLIIHPFEKTIISQYKKRKKIFLNKNILPEFDIDTIKAVQSLSSEDSRFKSWFDALEYMKDKISKKDFDIALIGCGAYGLPLSSHVKKMGKIGIHMGGSLQLLFGIKGKRWDDNPIIKKLYNKHWVRPSEIEKPKNYKKVEEVVIGNFNMELYGLNKILRAIIRDFFFRLKSLNGSKKPINLVFCNSFPKSGTHLLYDIIIQSKKLKKYDDIISYQSLSGIINSFDHINFKIRSAKSNSIIRSHLYYEKKIVDLIFKELKAKMIFITRDPRAVASSYSHWILK